VDLQELLQAIAPGPQIAQPPAGHGIGLGDGIDGDDIVREPGRADVLSPVDEMLIDLIGEQSNIPVLGDLGQGFHLLCCSHRSGGIGGRVED